MFTSRVPTQHKDKIHNTLQVEPRGGKLAPGSCSKLPLPPLKRGPNEGGSEGSNSKARTARASAKRPMPEFELEVEMPEEQDPPYVVRQAKSARNY